jgi:signal transduction histidine kinase
MRTLSWLGRVLLVPAVGVGLLVWWVAAALGRNGYDMSSWAVLLLFGGLALSRATPRVAIVAFYVAFALQFVRGVCRFDQVGWLAYAAIPLAAIVYGAVTAEHRRRALGVLLSLGLLTGLFTNVPALGRIDFSVPGQGDDPGAYWGFIDGVGIVNGKIWPASSAFGLAEILVGTIVWSAGAMLLVLAGWTIGSGYRARRLQWAAEARSDVDRAALTVSNADLRLAEQRDRIAQDVHDITAHRLSVILAQADGAAAHASDPDTRATLATISGSARSALTEIRTLLENLDDPTDGDTTRGVTDVRGLIAAASSEGVPVTLEEHGAVKQLSNSAGLAAYRIVQEALTNAIRHGTGDAIRATLDWRDEGLAIFVVSSLQANAASTDDKTGRGLPGMKERARFVGGWLTAGRDGTDYIVAAHIPTAETPAT